MHDPNSLGAAILAIFMGSFILLFMDKWIESTYKVTGTKIPKPFAVIFIAFCYVFAIFALIGYITGWRPF